MLKENRLPEGTRGKRYNRGTRQTYARNYRLYPRIRRCHLSDRVQNSITCIASRRAMAEGESLIYVMRSIGICDDIGPMSYLYDS